MKIQVRVIRKKVKDNEMFFSKIVSENEIVTLIDVEIGDDVFSQKFFIMLFPVDSICKRSQNRHSSQGFQHIPS